jgi:arsenate reductase
MTVTIYHNPRCSKSRQTLSLLESAAVQLDVVEYLAKPPSAADILDLARLLGLPVAGLLRRGEPEFRDATDLPDLGDDAAVATWIAAHPKVLQRPIVVNAQRTAAVIGRPPENALELVGR